MSTKIDEALATLKTDLQNQLNEVAKGTGLCNSNALRLTQAINQHSTQLRNIGEVVAFCKKTSVKSSQKAQSSKMSAKPQIEDKIAEPLSDPEDFKQPEVKEFCLNIGRSKNFNIKSDDLEQQISGLRIKSVQALYLALYKTYKEQDEIKLLHGS